MTYEEQAEERTDKEIAERLVMKEYLYEPIGELAVARNDGKRQGYHKACMFFLPKIREAVEALEDSNGVLERTGGDQYEQAQGQAADNLITLASLRGVLTPKT